MEQIYVSDKVAVKAYNVDLQDVIHTVLDRPLCFDITGSHPEPLKEDYPVAENVNINVTKSDAYIVFDRLFTENVNLNVAVDRLEIGAIPVKKELIPGKEGMILGTQGDIYTNLYWMEMEYKIYKPEEKFQYIPFYLHFTEDGKIETNAPPNILLFRHHLELFEASVHAPRFDSGNSHILPSPDLQSLIEIP